MHKDLHDIDELFHSGLNDYEATPSAGVKENIDAVLDKQDAEKYKKRFIIWKRAALLLLLLLAGLVIYESGLIKKGSGGYIAKEPANENDKANNKSSKENTSDNSNDIITNQPVNQNNNLSEQQNQNDIIAAPENSLITGNEVFIFKNTRPDKKVNWLTQKQNLLLPDITSQPDKETIIAEYDNANSQTSKHNIEALDKRISIASIAERITKNFSLLPPFTFSNLPATVNNKPNPNKKKANGFKPFWMIAPFASYEQSGYKLDSDDPLTASTIKHREVNEPSFSGGILATRQFTKHWGLQSGLVYTSTQIGINPQKMYALQLPGGDIAYKFITSSGYAFIKLGIGPPPAIGDSITTSDAKHLLKHISVPLSVKYKMGKNKFTVSPSAGIEANFISSAKVEVGVDLSSNREIVTVNKMEGIKSFYWSAVTGVEASYQLNKKLSVNVQPVFRYALSPITKDNVVETFPRSFGIRAGITIKF